VDISRFPSAPWSSASTTCRALQQRENWTQYSAARVATLRTCSADANHHSSSIINIAPRACFVPWRTCNSMCHAATSLPVNSRVILYHHPAVCRHLRKPNNLASLDYDENSTSLPKFHSPLYLHLHRIHDACIRVKADACARCVTAHAHFKSVGDGANSANINPRSRFNCLS